MSPSTSPTPHSKGKPTKGKGKGWKGKERKRWSTSLLSEGLPHNVHPQLLLYAFGVDNQDTTVMHVPILPLGHQHPADLSHLPRRPRPLSPMPMWSPPMWKAGNPRRALYMELWTMVLAASNVLIGHNTLMKNLKNLYDSGRNLKHLCFRPVDKVFHFGGDASSRSEWSIHLPVNISGSFGRIQVFVIPGDTSFLLGRPILKHFKIQIDYSMDKITINGGQWTSAIKGPREEYLIDLHSSNDDWWQDWDFDLMTDDTKDNFNYQPDSDTINLEEYLNVTQLPRPEFTFTTDDNFLEDNLNSTSPSPVLQPHLDHVHQHTEKISRKRVVDRILHFYDKGVKQFWEVYGGQSNLSKAMSRLGYEVTTFDLHSGWDFEKAHHRREFFKLRKVSLTLCGWHRPALCGALFRVV